MKEVLLLFYLVHIGTLEAFVPILPLQKTTSASALTFTRSYVRPNLDAQKLVKAEPESAEPSPATANEVVLISSLPDYQQQLALAGIFAALFTGAGAIVLALDKLDYLLPPLWFDNWETTWPLGLGPVFMLAGIGHFVAMDSFSSIVPPQGTWGFWPVPTAPKFHSAWTGVCEFVGGALLTSAGLAPFFGYAPPVELEVCSGALLALLIAVTPANTYMATHDVTMEGTPPVPYPSGHIIRGAFQSLLFAFFWIMTFQD